MIQKEPYLGVDEAAEYLCLHVETVRRMARSGHLPAVKIGRSWRFKISTLDQWALEQVSERLSHGSGQLEGEGDARMLCLDDDEDVLVFVAGVLGGEGYRVEATSDPAHAETCLLPHAPDLLLLDLQLSGMSGAEFLAKTYAQVKEVPVVIITNYPDSQLLMDVMKLMPVTMLAKPLQKASLLQAVRSVLKTSQ